MTLIYSEDNQHLTRKLAGIPLFLTFVKKKGSIYTPARSLISHLHALTRNEPARAVVTDKFNTFTLEQELNMDETLREFFNDVYEITRQIPRGKVLTYGRIAALAGRPQHARWVGRAMAQSPDDKTLPCHRVVNSAGQTAPGWTEQRTLLENEGVTFRPNGHVDMKKHLWEILSADEVTS